MFKSLVQERLNKKAIMNSLNCEMGPNFGITALPAPLRENLHVAVHEALKEITTDDMREFFKYTGYINT